MAKKRLDVLLVERGLAASRDRAQALILAGEVLVSGRPAGKAGDQVEVDAELALRAGDHPYVSRGALKLEKGLSAFSVDPAGWVAVDVGASTGGFTDLLLARGARKVYAIDVGYGQLAWSLRQDPRVVNIERTNVRYLDPSQIPEKCDLAVIDVSFISLALVLPTVHQLLHPRGLVIALVKPQFEAGKDKVGKGGVVRDPAVRLACVDQVRAFAEQNGFIAGRQEESPITGPAGNVEYLLELQRDDSPYSGDPG